VLWAIKFLGDASIWREDDAAWDMPPVLDVVAFEEAVQITAQMFEPAFPRLVAILHMVAVNT
jgi:hypothetical protein